MTTTAESTARYRDASLSPETRAADLLARMTLEEKAAQMVGVWQLKTSTLVADDGTFDLEKALVPAYMKAMPRTDGWMHPFQVQAMEDGYLVYSSGKDGDGESCEPAVTNTFNDEICFANGQFVRYPAGTQN